MNEDEAFSRLRSIAMHRRVTLELAARSIVEDRPRRQIG